MVFAVESFARKAPAVGPKELEEEQTGLVIFDVECDVARRTPGAILNVYDVENDALSVASFTPPTHGRAVADGDVTFTYTPAAGFTGMDEFAVTVSDGRGGSRRRRYARA